MPPGSIASSVPRFTSRLELWYPFLNRISITRDTFYHMIHRLSMYICKFFIFFEKDNGLFFSRFSLAPEWGGVVQ